MALALLSVTLLYLYTATVIAEEVDPKPPSQNKPYSRCELLVLGLSDKVNDALSVTMRALDQRISRFEPWTLSEVAERNIADLFNDVSLSDDELFAKLYDQLSLARQNNLSLLSRFFVRRAARKAVSHDSIYARTIGKRIKNFFGPHYNGLFNRIASTGRIGWNNTPLDTLVAFHEFEHLVDRNQNPSFWLLMGLVKAQEIFSAVLRTPFSVPLTRATEVKAMGAQWEFVKRIPESVRERLLSRREDLHFFTTRQEQRALEGLISTGVIHQIETAIKKALPVIVPTEAPSSSEASSESSAGALRTTVIFALIGRESLGNWFNLVKRHGRKNLSTEEFNLLKGVYEQGLFYEPILAKVSHCLESFSTSGDRTYEDSPVQESFRSRIVSPDEQLFYDQILSELRYGDKAKSLEKLEDIFYSSLEFAHLPKDEFIHRLSHVHGYTMSGIYHNHYRIQWRAILIYASFFGATIGLDTMAFNRGNDEWWSPDLILANDLRQIAQALQYLFGL